MNKITVKGQYTPQYDKVNNCNIGDKVFSPGMVATTKVQEPTFLNLLNAHASDENRWFVISEHDYLTFIQSRGRTIENIPADILEKLNMVSQVEIKFKKDKEVWGRIEAENINLKDQESVSESEKELVDFYAVKNDMTDEEIENKAKEIFAKVDTEREKVRDEKIASDKKAEEEKQAKQLVIFDKYERIIEVIMNHEELTAREQEILDKYNKYKQNTEVTQDFDEVEKITEEFASLLVDSEVATEEAEAPVVEAAETTTETVTEEAAKTKTSKKTTAKK